MPSPAMFAYAPSAAAVKFTINGVNCAIDMFVTAPGGELKFGVLEIVSSASAQWMGTDANTAGNPAWTIETLSSQLGDSSAYFDVVTKQQYNGSALQIINAAGTSMITNWKAILNATIARRFSAVTPQPTSPPFTDENAAIAWLIAQVGVLIKAPVNGVVP